MLVKEDLSQWMTLLCSYMTEKKRFSNTKYKVIKAKFKTPRYTTRPNNKGKVKRVENEVLLPLCWL